MGLRESIEDLGSGSTAEVKTFSERELLLGLKGLILRDVQCRRRERLDWTRVEIG